MFCSWVVKNQLRRPHMASLSYNLYDMPELAPHMIVFILRAIRLSSKFLEQRYVKERFDSSLKKFYGRYWDLIKQYKVPLSWMLNGILTKYNDNPPPIRLDTYLWPFYRIMRGFNRTLVTGVTCRHGTLTPQDTWFRLKWDLHMFYLLRPILFP